MPQKMLAESLPLFRAARHRSCDVIPAPTQRRNPFIVAVGSSCGVQRAADGTASPFISALAPSVCQRSKTCSVPTAHRQLFSSRSAGPQRPSEQRCGGSRRLSWRTHLSQLLSEEQITRWRLRCEEQEERVEIALAKPSCRVVFSQVDVAAARSALGQGDERLGCGAYSRPHLPRSELVCATANEAHSLRAGRRRIKTKKHYSSGRRGGLQEHPTSETQNTASAPGPLYVRDSELLCALQRAEARIKQLEAGIVLQASAPWDKENTMSASSSTMAKPQASAFLDTIHPFLPLSPRLETL
ncbi:conserved hypothetical protein [Leishmania major strain Friedlin]|uniref:Uncharacterized protein n=1 Tax=Leishmania major TaxID=5664 RepID=Q4QES9_LEIMA|nr:conserved hypothetical protein [Leishmania major strain Friedlin]CAG9572125.1 hypothetical_protein_-_conserved [Leishmania major strain Friedlin]CAJ03699.1 conserved hypothetical protein [Leishmania major strain Friedlin]|eukprot:XP_001682169.1 conserved hypothetical protein [Leishmania major strain Friedlin]